MAQDPDSAPDCRAAADGAADSRAVPPATRQATLPQVVGAVLWSFFGVRKGKAMQRDAVTIRPHQVIIAGVLIAASLVAALLILVRIITHQA
ncbi:MAG TPA: DUF2970 domain-containing protein [Casimicrobiaceae bacterium]|nr:DUF2970 domain-containing protein [Casimicrobiaceae bacterium]